MLPRLFAIGIVLVAVAVAERWGSGLFSAARTVMADQQPSAAVRHRPQQPGGMQMMPDPIVLAGRPDVQKALGISDEQEYKLGALQQETLEKIRKLRQPYADLFAKRPSLLTAQERKRLSEYFARSGKVATERTKKMKVILEPKQYERLYQLMLQQAPLSFILTAGTNPESPRGRLGVTEEQKAEIHQIEKEFDRGQSKRMDWMYMAGHSREDHRTAEQRRADIERGREETQRCWKKAQEDMLAVLTDEQRAKFKEMLGEPFRFEKIETELEKQMSERIEKAKKERANRQSR